MDFTDLLLVLIYCTVLYAVVVAIARKPRFLTKGINPHRGTVLLASISVLVAAAGLLRLEAGSGNVGQWGALLGKLVTHEPTPPRVQGAAVAILFGALLLLLLLWCWWFLPRDPSTFQGPHSRQKALKYFVLKLKGGLDYALLAEGDSVPIAEATDTRWVGRSAEYLPKVQGQNGETHSRIPTEQVAYWRATARSLHAHMTELDSVVLPAEQGKNRRLVFDLEFGAIFFIYLRAPGSTGSKGLYLFAATLSQHEVNSKAADQHFDLLVEALRHTERAIKLD